MPDHEDGNFSVAARINRIPRKLYPDLESSKAWYWEDTYTIKATSYTASDPGSLSLTLRDPGTGTNKTFYLAKENVVSNFKDLLTFTRIWVCAYSNITSPGSVLFNIANPHGLKSGSSYAVTHQPDRFRVYADRIAIASVPDLGNTIQDYSGSTSESINDLVPAKWSDAVFTVTINNYSFNPSSSSPSSMADKLISADGSVLLGSGSISFENLTAEEAIEVTISSSYYTVTQNGNSFVAYKLPSGNRTVTDNRLITTAKDDSLRTINTSTPHGKTAGAKVAVFNEDEIGGLVTVERVNSTTSFSIKVADLPGKEIEATHIGGNTYSEYSLTAPDVTSTVTKSFYIPGITGGITTWSDVPVLQGDDTAQEQLDALVNGDTYLQVSGSKVGNLFPGLIVREVEEVKLTDVFKQL